jgi:hypothetical protein
MRVAIVQYDNRSGTGFLPLKLLIARNQAYAKLHGYQHFFCQSEPSLPVYWYKVYLVHQYLSSGFDIVAWLDSDAVFHKFTIPIESLFENSEMFVFSSDLPVFAPPSPFNAGIFLAKGAFGLDLMGEWLSLYPADFWTKQDSQWVCKHPVWAGPAYEQGTFAEKLLPKYEDGPFLKRLPWEMLQNPYPIGESMTLHFPRFFRSNCYIYLTHMAKIPTQNI